VVRSVRVWALSTLVVAAWLPVLAVVRLADRDPVRRSTGLWFRRLGRALARLHGSRVRVRGEELPDVRGTYVVVSNHQSLADIPVLCHLPWEMKWLAKAELFRVPVVGWMMRMAADIPVDRGRRAQAVAALRRAERTLAQGCSVMVFPEGTRSPDGRVGPFNDGAFHLAIRAGVPVLPIAVLGSRECLPRASWRMGHPAAVEVRVFPPISTDALGERAVGALRDRARELIAGHVAASTDGTLRTGEDA
jgi:1-acyl-sn-glycerol-3-phosphate acyltransferase